MPSKITSFLAEHYPNTYMEQFCKTLHPDLELGTVCLSWFRQATKHCTDLLNDVKSQHTYFWTTVKNFIFPDRTTELMSQKIPINIHPQRLSIQDCQSLFLDMVSDYVQRAPRYAAESTTNFMLWQILYSFMGIMALGSLLVGIIYTFNKYGPTKDKKNPLDDFFTNEKRMQASAKRSLNFSKSELRNIHIKPIAKTEDIVPTDGAEVVAFKIGTKYETLESMVQGSLQTVGKFHRLYDQYNKTKTDFKIESLNKAMKFLDNNCKKLHLLIMFEDSLDYEEELALRKHKTNSPRIKSLSPPAIATQRIASAYAKHLTNARLEGGNVSPKTTNDIDIASSTRRSNSPNVLGIRKRTNTPKQVTTPRSSGAVSSGIPRNILKRLTPPPPPKKSK